MRKKIILILASIATFVEALDIAIINLTIPTIQEQFLVSNDTVQWLQTLYVLFFGGVIIIGGKLTDEVGRKKMFLIGGVLFTLASLGAGLSTDFNSLAVFRALQGLAAAFIMPAAFSIVTHTFQEPKERSRAVGIVSSFAAIGSGAGLSVGGLISTYWGWHWVFLINVPILLVTLVLAAYYLPKAELEPKMHRTDYTSGILLMLGLLLLTFGVHELNNFTEKAYLVGACLVGATVLLTLAVKRILSIANPLIDPALFKHKSVVVSNAAFFMLGALFVGFLFLVSLMLQRDMNHSSAAAGLMLVPFSVLSALTAKFILPTIIKHFDTPKMGVLGMSFMFAGTATLLASFYFNHSLVLVLLAAACISGIGMTICFTSFSVLSVRDVNQKDYGLTSSLTSTTYFLGAGLGLSFMTLVSQFAPSAWAVSPLSLIILVGYAALGVIIMFFFSKKDNYQEGE